MCGIDLGMDSVACSSCQKPKAALSCGLCGQPLCKYCVQALDEADFSFLPEIPEELGHPFYCAGCFDATVAPQLLEYNEILEQAKGVFVFTKDQGKESRLIKRKEAPLKVTDCVDQNETILRLAFLAARAKHNAIVDVQITSEKVRNAGYQSTKWSGVAIPASIDPRRYEGRPVLSNPN